MRLTQLAFLRRTAVATVLAVAGLAAGSARAGFTYAYQFGTSGSGNGQFREPADLATDTAGNIYVSDSQNSRVEEFTNAGIFIRAFGSRGSGTGQFVGATQGVAVDSTGNVFISDVSGGRIQEFSNTGTFIRTFGSQGSGTGQFNGPAGMAIDAAGNVFVVDNGNDRVEVFTNTGTFVRSFGLPGSGNGRLIYPTNLAIDAAGNVFVTDTGNSRVVEFTAAGTFIRAFGSAGSGDGQFGLGGAGSPFGVSIDAVGNVYVGDTRNFRVQEFTNTGTFIQAFGSVGTGDGQFGNGQFGGPSGVVVDASGKVFVSDYNNNRIEAFISPSVVPEPGSLCLFATGVAFALGARSWRRRRESRGRQDHGPRG